ncbi:MAG TPA: hypothetical protein VI819_00075 [Patescibacteria group bacterium]|nr:hypothetical protein [Patescibacteria group bacterium]
MKGLFPNLEVESYGKEGGARLVCKADGNACTPPSTKMIKVILSSDKSIVEGLEQINVPHNGCDWCPRNKEVTW